jgi:peptidoglycan/xylan/chitin deacetylase (PgdA/CDA1 family)
MSGTRSSVEAADTIMNMDRRSFLRRTGLVAGGSVLGAATAVGIEQSRIDLSITTAGHAVGADRPAGLLTTSINYRVATTEPTVALTFDDGPSTKYTARVLDILEQKGVVATFFLIGEHARALPALARRAAATHEIGNHTWSHPNMGLYAAPDAAHQLGRAALELESVIGRKPALFRPPYGAFSGATAMIATSLRYPIMLWDIEFNQHGDTAAANVDRLSRLAGPGSIILGHDGGTLNCEVVVAALPTLIDRLRDRGLGFATVSDLLALGQVNRGATEVS